MIGRLAIVGLVAAAAGISQANAAANNPLVTWQGSATLTSLSGACATLKFNVGDLAHSIYRPRLDPAEPKSALTMLFTRSALSFFQNSGPDQMTGAGAYKGQWISGRATATTNLAATSGNYNFTVTPSPVLIGTTNITIQGTLTNFGNTAGCTAGFRGVYTKRP